MCEIFGRDLWDISGKANRIGRSPKTFGPKLFEIFTPNHCALVRTSVKQTVPVVMDMVVDIKCVPPVDLLEWAFMQLPLRDLLVAVLVCRRCMEAQ